MPSWTPLTDEQWLALFNDLLTLAASYDGCGEVGTWLAAQIRHAIQVRTTTSIVHWVEQRQMGLVEGSQPWIFLQLAASEIVAVHSRYGRRF